MHDAAWRSTAMLRALLAVAIGVYVFVSLYPFELELPRTVPNDATWVVDNSIVFKRPGVLKSRTHSALLAEAVNRRELKLSLHLKPALSEQFGPARILSSSLNIYHRNLTIAQDGHALVICVRTTRTNENGRLGGEPIAIIADVFEVGTWVEINVEIDRRNLLVTIDGQTRWAETLPGEPFVTWDRDFRWFVGNEGTLNRPWLGVIKRIEWQSSDILTNILTPAHFEAPPNYLFVPNFPKLIPFRDFSERDAIENVIMYVPIGLLFGVFYLLRFGARGIAKAIGLSFVLSLSMESAQFFISVRNTSVDDLLFNTLGGASGGAFAWAALLAMRVWRNVETLKANASTKPRD